MYIYIQEKPLWQRGLCIGFIYMHKLYIYMHKYILCIYFMDVYICIFLFSVFGAACYTIYMGMYMHTYTLYVHARTHTFTVICIYILTILNVWNCASRKLTDDFFVNILKCFSLTVSLLCGCQLQFYGYRYSSMVMATVLRWRCSLVGGYIWTVTVLRL